MKLLVSFDMGWAQRSNGYFYDSLSGFCAILGYHTGKALDYMSYNRKCSMCDSNIKNNTNKPHDCRLNFWGSAKAMESTGAV